MNALRFQRSMQPGDWINLIVIPTTGGTFQLSVSCMETIIGLKRTLARKLNLRADRMSLLLKDRLLVHGNLRENHVINGSHITLVPNMETGTGTTRTDSRVIQALETLTERQVNDFLTGRAPLLLAMRFGEHMMFVQLQLSTSACAARRRTLHPTNCGHAANATHSHQEKPRCPCSPAAPHSGLGHTSTPGASIDSINHLGHGVYSGTFSGTLDPSVHEASEKPKRDINTILQILNDLLLASPQFRQNSHMFSQQENTAQNSHVLGQVQLNGQSETDVDAQLQGKVQALQRRMQERRRQRQEKRGMRAPYQWPQKRSLVSEHLRNSSRVNYDSPLACDRDLGTKNEAITAAAADSATFPTAASGLEHESVLV